MYQQLAKTRQAGDTIIEVLVSIAVVSLVLGGAYVVTNDSLQSTRSAQERAIALKIAESQIEQIKGLTINDPDALFGVGAPNTFCIDNTGVVVDATDDSCTVDTSGAPAATGVQPRFNISIVRTNNNFVLTQTWESVDGQSNDSLQLVYRAYEQT